MNEFSHLFCKCDPFFISKLESALLQAAVKQRELQRFTRMADGERCVVTKSSGICTLLSCALNLDSTKSLKPDWLQRHTLVLEVDSKNNNKNYIIL